MKIAVIILLVLCALLAGAVMYLLSKKVDIVEISDDLPASGNLRDCWLKLQNEGKQYIKIEDGKVYLKIVK